MGILITGGSGFIGSNLADKLLQIGYSVITIDNFDEFYSKDIKLNNIKEAKKNPHFQLIEGDIRDKGFLEKCFLARQIDLVVHLASKAGVRPSILQPTEYYDVNVNGTLQLLETMKKYDVKKLIFASSSSVYGNNKKVPFSEKDNVDFPISPYAASKKAAELLCHTYHHLYDFEITCLRFFTVYGPRQRPDLAIHKFTKAILNEEEIQMYGVGTSERDYTYIDDIVDGITKAIINLQGFNIYNLGESRTIKLRELIKLLEQMIGKKARIKKLPEQPGDVDRTFADISKARKEIGYSPKFEFEEGLRNFIKWYKEVK